MKLPDIKNQNGVASLMVVIVVVGTILGIALILTKLSINELVIDFDAEQSHRLMQISDGCAEEAYWRVKRDTSYTGGSIAFGDGNCNIAVSGSGGTRTASIEATVNDFTRDFSADITIQSNIAGNARGIDLTDWVENF
ncbi:MAG: hypothetical protein ABH846_02585 [Patescibacteria group bacterium]